MFSCTTYRVHPRFDSARGIDTYEICDGATLRPVGCAEEVPPAKLARWVRGALGRNLLRSRVRVYATDQNMPAFSLQEVRSCWSPRVEVRDSDNVSLCSFEGKFATVGGGFTVLGSRNQVLAAVENEPGTWRYFFRTCQGRQIGTIVDEVSFHPPRGTAGHYRIDLSPNDPVDAENPGRCRLWLLAATLALDLIYRDRV
ncbi:MAG: hypothetical protein U1G07_22575 [Verrucomicrobiota bacterium]